MKKKTSAFYLYFKTYIDRRLKIVSELIQMKLYRLNII